MFNESQRVSPDVCGYDDCRRCATPHRAAPPSDGAARTVRADRVRGGEVEKLVLTQRNRVRAVVVSVELEPAGAGAGGARLEVEQEAEHPGDFE
jgi:hypothetical protein